jgi:adenylate kinase family enzyme
MKILIFGPPGAGKSTLAFAGSRQTGLPVFHLDHHFFKAPNIHVGTQEALQELAATLPTDDWIVEGNHGDALPYLCEKADHIIVLKVSPWVCVYRVIKRHIQQDVQLKKAISPGWEEKLSWQFLWFIFWIFPKHLPKNEKLITQHANGKIHHVRRAQAFDWKEMQLK